MKKSQRRRRYSVHVGAASLVLALAAIQPMSGGSSATAAEATPQSATPEATASFFVDGRGSEPELPDESLVEADIFAKQTGRERAEYTEVLAENKFAEVATKVEDKYSRSFVKAGIYRTQEADADYYLRLKFEPSQDIIDWLTELYGETEIFVDPEFLDTSEQSEASTAIRMALRDEKSIVPATFQASVDDLGTGIDVKFATFADGVPQPSRGDVSIVDAAKAGAEAIGRPSIPVNYVRPESVSPITSEATVIGGRRLEQGGAAVCTDGFTVKRGSQYGLVTARHCPNETLTYRGVSGIIDFIANADPDGSAVIDMQFHRTLSPHTTDNQFQFGTTTQIRNVTAWSNPVASQYICVHGITTVTDCAYVSGADNTCADITWPIEGTVHWTCRLARTTQWITGGGDSGGPWFNNSTAIGIHSAGGPAGSFLTRIRSIPVYLDANVLIS